VNEDAGTLWSERDERLTADLVAAAKTLTEAITAAREAGLFVSFVTRSGGVEVTGVRRNVTLPLQTRQTEESPMARFLADMRRDWYEGGTQ
jgi:hypothetical protein